MKPISSTLKLHSTLKRDSRRDRRGLTSDYKRFPLPLTFILCLWDTNRLSPLLSTTPLKHSWVTSTGNSFLWDSSGFFFNATAACQAERFIWRLPLAFHIIISPRICPKSNGNSRNNQTNPNKDERLRSKLVETYEDSQWNSMLNIYWWTIRRREILPR